MLNFTVENERLAFLKVLNTFLLNGVLYCGIYFPKRNFCFYVWSIRFVRLTIGIDCQLEYLE